MNLFRTNSRYFWLFPLLLLIGLTQYYDLPLGVRIPLAEVIAFASLPFVLRGVPVGRFRSRLIVVFLLFLTWVVAIFISDLVNGFIFERFIRAVAKPIWCVCWFLFFLGVLYKDFRALLLYPLGLVFASVQNYFLPQGWTADRIEAGGYTQVAYGLTPVITTCCLLLAVWLYKKSRVLSASLFMINGVALMVLGSPRSAAAMLILNGLIVLYIAWMKRGGKRVFRLTPGRVFVFGLIFMVLSFALYEAYVASAETGWLGEEQQMKLLDQSDTVFGDSFLGLILDGRTSVFGAILAIIDQPIFGYGSWTGWLMSDYFYEAMAMVGTNAREMQQLALSGQMPGVGHSILFQAWMENGILAGLVMLVAGYYVLREFLLLIQRDSRVAPLLIFFATAFFWAFLFSPFGVRDRLVLGLFFAFYVMKFHDVQFESRREEGLPPQMSGPR